MNITEIGRVVDRALRDCGPFSNLHGITRENLHALVVVPVEVIVDPDDLETPPRPMWLVIHEPVSGFFIAHDPASPAGALPWTVVERTPGTDVYTCVVASESLAGALDGM